MTEKDLEEVMVPLVHDELHKFYLLLANKLNELPLGNGQKFGTLCATLITARVQMEGMIQVIKKDILKLSEFEAARLNRIEKQTISNRYEELSKAWEDTKKESPSS